LWTIVGILLSVLACSDQPLPASAIAQSAPSLGSSDLATTQPSAAEVASAIQAHLVNGLDPVFGVLTRAERVELTALYQSGAGSPLWTDATGRPIRQVRESLDLLNDARAEGLDPADYGHDALDSLAATLKSASPPLPQNVASFDVALSRAMLRYLRHLHLGRIDPRTIGFRLKVATEGHDFAALLRSALADDRIVETIAELRPPLGQYNALRTMLVRYRSLAGDGSLESPPAAAVVRPGEPYAGLDVLYRQLVAFGDLPARTQAAAVPETYEGALVEGVKRFQIRHGLEPDGLLGKGTQAALRVRLAWRVRQVELALERLRWLPDLGARRLLAINIPMFRLWAWDSVSPNDAPTLAMDVIVGRALSTQTPVFDEEMREVIFRPYWNVPRSILRNEILPLLECDLDYLRRQNMEIVRGPGDNAQPVEATAENLVLLRQGALRLRQRPGPDNSLGLVKFVFPNEENVYMHGTPAQALFSRSRRDFSHGCVRVEDPVALAEGVLKERPEWTHDRILSAMAGTESLHVSLPRPIQVILFYTTAVVMPEDGTIHFADDIYRHDARLDRELARPHSSQ
jgi:murein L,D-transpeptidase YcbB/YkuD